MGFKNNIIYRIYKALRYNTTGERFIPSGFFSKLEQCSDKEKLKILNKLYNIKNMNLKQQYAQKMLDEKLDFLSLEDSLELLNNGIEVKTRLSYVAYIEEVEDGYNCDLDIMFKEMDDVYGIYDEEDKLMISDDILMIKERRESFERLLCPAPTYIDLIR